METEEELLRLTLLTEGHSTSQLLNSQELFKRNNLSAKQLRIAVWAVQTVDRVVHR